MTNTRVPPRQPRRVGRDTVSSSPPPPPLELPPNSLLRKSINVTGEDEEGARGRLLRLLRRGAHGSKSGHFLLKTESNSGKGRRGRGEKTYETYVVRLREQANRRRRRRDTGRLCKSPRDSSPLPLPARDSPSPSFSHPKALLPNHKRIEPCFIHHSILGPGKILSSLLLFSLSLSISSVRESG